MTSFVGSRPATPEGADLAFLRELVRHIRLWSPVAHENLVGVR